MEIDLSFIKNKYFLEKLENCLIQLFRINVIRIFSKSNFLMKNFETKTYLCKTL